MAINTDNLTGVGADVARALGVPLLQTFGDAGPGAQPLIIEQITGAGTRIELYGRALPVNTIAFGGITQRTSKTTYQGNPEATLQVMGPEYPDAVFEGKWKDRFIQGQVAVDGDTGAIATAAQLVAIFEQWAEAGNTVRVQWATQVRFGVLKHFAPVWDRVQDVAWRMEFEWFARNAVQPAGPAATDSLPTPDKLLSALNDIDDALALVEDFPKAVTANLVATIDSAREQIGKLFAFTRAINTLLDLPGALVGAVASAVASLIVEFADETGRMTEASSQNMSITTSVASVLQTENSRRDLGQKMTRVSVAALAIENALRAAAQPVATKQVTVAKATTLYDLSSRFYGSPDFAAFLAAYNGVSGALIEPGTVMLIPPQPQPQAGQDAPNPYTGGAIVHGR